MLKGFVAALVGLVGPAVGADDGGSDREDRCAGVGFLGMPDKTLEESGRPAEGVLGRVAFGCVNEFKHGKINYEGKN